MTVNTRLTTWQLNDTVEGFFLLEIFLHCLYSHFYCVLHFKWDFHDLVSQYIVKLFNIHRLHNVPKVTLFQLCLQVLTQLKQQRIYTLIKYCLLFFDFKRSLFFLITNDLTLYTCLLMRPKLFRVHFLIFTFPRSTIIVWIWEKNLHLNYLKPGQNLTLLNIIVIKTPPLGQRNKHEIKRSEFLAVSNYWEIQQ